MMGMFVYSRSHLLAGVLCSRGVPRPLPVWRTAASTAVQSGGSPPLPPLPAVGPGMLPSPSPSPSSSSSSSSSSSPSSSSSSSSSSSPSSSSPSSSSPSPSPSPSSSSFSSSPSSLPLSLLLLLSLLSPPLPPPPLSPSPSSSSSPSSLFPSSSAHFSSLQQTFGDSRTTVVTSKHALQFLLKCLSEAVPHEPPFALRVGMHSPSPSLRFSLCLSFLPLSLIAHSILPSSGTHRKPTPAHGQMPYSYFRLHLPSQDKTEGPKCMHSSVRPVSVWPVSV